MQKFNKLKNLTNTYVGHIYAKEASLNLKVPGQDKPMLLLDVSTSQGPDMHLDLFGQEEPVLLLYVSTPQGLSCTWTYLDTGAFAAL
jgi:hypothetical protein